MNAVEWIIGFFILAIVLAMFGFGNASGIASNAAGTILLVVVIIVIAGLFMSKSNNLN